MTPPTELRITAVRISGDNLQIQLAVNPGQSYTIESLSDLESDKWEIFTGSAILTVKGLCKSLCPFARTARINSIARGCCRS